MASPVLASCRRLFNCGAAWKMAHKNIGEGCGEARCGRQEIVRFLSSPFFPFFARHFPCCAPTNRMPVRGYSTFVSSSSTTKPLYCSSTRYKLTPFFVQYKITHHNFYPVIEPNGVLVKPLPALPDLWNVKRLTAQRFSALRWLRDSLNTVDRLPV